MSVEFGGERALAVGRKLDMRNDVSHVDRVNDFHVGALDRQDADRLVGAVGDEREVACRIEAEARWLLANRHRVGELGRVGF